MIVPDVNLLLYAHIDTFPQHPTARAWWETLVREGTPVGLCEPVVFGFVRISTNPRVFTPALSVSAAATLVRDWLSRPRIRWLVAGPDHPALVLELLLEVGTASNLTTDAQVAAYAMAHHATVASCDTDFGRFSGVKSHNPLRQGR
ncbi:MAG: PIN domain-containing protein [Deltaproteobacteria bacterium]|nr:PIN domain-containing protein [Deltaproteobacteria bacterium]